MLYLKHANKFGEPFAWPCKKSIIDQEPSVEYLSVDFLMARLDKSDPEHKRTIPSGQGSEYSHQYFVSLKTADRSVTEFGQALASYLNQTCVMPLYRHPNTFRFEQDLTPSDSSKWATLDKFLLDEDVAKVALEKYSKLSREEIVSDPTIMGIFFSVERQEIGAQAILASSYVVNQEESY